MIITDELAGFFPNQDVIASVFAHELAHVPEVHGLKQVYRSLAGLILLAVCKYIRLAHCLGSTGFISGFFGDDG